MSAQLLRIDDPRDKLEKATRDELYDFARAQGVTDITEDMPAILMRRILRSKGKTNIDIPNRPLGSNPGVVAPPDKAQDVVAVPEITAEEDLMRQYQAAKVAPAEMTMGQMRAECKRRGIKMARTDNMDTLRAKLNG